MLGTVSRTAVVCRSAPASRAGSRVREAAATDGGLWKKGTGDAAAYGREKRSLRAEEPKRQRQRGRERGRGRPRDDGVPSLARTRAEGDIWSRTSGRAADKSRWDEDGEGDDEDGDEDEGHSSSEGELDLARMLVPPKRQHSIKSLRRHLQPPTNNAMRFAAAGREGAATPVWNDREDEDEDWWNREGWHGKRGRRGSAFEDEEGYPIAGLWSAGEGSGAGKKRRGIPGVWAHLAGLGT